MWQALYHQLPLNVAAQLDDQASLSESLVENAIPLWDEKESPAVPVNAITKILNTN